jgi:2'-5' RNA ligase
MKQRKVFIGVNIPGKVAQRLGLKVAPWQHYPLRWVKERNYHITLDFLGHIDDDSIVDVCEHVREVCDTIAPFDVLLKDIHLVPEAGRAAQMLWLSGEPSDELLDLRKAIGEALHIPSGKNKAFAPHVTLGRIRETQWQALDTPPVLEGTFSVLIPIETVVVFESVFEGGVGLTYEPLGIYDLNGE